MWERYIDWLPLTCTLTGNRTHDLSVYRMTLQTAEPCWARLGSASLRLCAQTYAFPVNRGARWGPEKASGLLGHRAHRASAEPASPSP